MPSVFSSEYQNLYICPSKEEGDLQIFVKYQNHSKSPFILYFLIRKSVYW